MICIIFGEVALRLFTPFPIHSGKNKAFDERLLYVLDTGLGDVDDSGFRNPAIPERVDIVAIGDSLTYGNNVFWRESWPYKLATMTGRSVYNFGVGGYSVYQYYQLFTQALKFRPKHVLIGLYVANDLAANCKLLNLPYWRKLAGEFGLKSFSCPDASLNQAKMVKKSKVISRLKDIGRASATLSAINYVRDVYFPMHWFVDSYTISTGSISLSLERKRVSRHAKATDLNRPNIVESFRIARSCSTE